MKKLYFLVAFSISLISVAQKDYSRYYNSWRLGLNLGGAWQTADYRSCWGMAGGITLEKGFHENSTNIFSFAIRGRYLGANTYGMDYNRNYDVKSNDAYNGKYNPSVNYSDSLNTARQYVYDNYKMKLDEGSLELQITFNRLRERKHVLLNLCGGIGFTSFQTKSDLLDGEGKMYDFSLVDSTGNKTKTINSYNALIDKKYESFAYGSKGGKLFTFSPSLGIGLGYQFSPGFSMLWEYKVTFPQGTSADLLDGKIGSNKDFMGGSNDYYHYTGLNLVFTLRGKHKQTKTTTNDETVYTNTVVAPPTNSITPPTNTVVTVAPTNPPVTSPVIPPTQTTQTIAVTTPTVHAQPVIPIEPKPIITFITPPVNGHVVNTQTYKISAQILNVTNANQIQFKFVGYGYSNFTFNAQTHILEYNATLNNGSNSIQITATNASGQDTKYTTVVFEQPKVYVNPPIVSFINPPQPGLVVSTKTYVVKAQVLNVTAQNQISVNYNGAPTQFTYNGATKQVSFTSNLNLGSNTISVTATNDGGQDSKTSDVVYRAVKVSGVPPIVNLISPSTVLNATDDMSYNFKLSVLNVNAKADIEVLFNGAAQSNFMYDPNTKEVFFQSNLSIGTNTLMVKGTNQFGSDFKQLTVQYTPHAEIKLPPSVTITNPVNTTTTSNPNYTFKAKVTNMPTTNGLVVKLNGTSVLNYVYDGFNLTYNANLVLGNNVFEVTATNNDGTDTKNASVNYKVKVVPVFPIVNLINPATSINATDDQLYNFKLSVLNVNTKSDIEVLYNGVSQSNFTYDVNTKEVFFQTNLSVGTNTLIVKGTNQFGSDSKDITVEYKPHIKLLLPPIITFISPANNNTNAPANTYTFAATIANMNNASSVTAKFNGVSVTNFSFDEFNFTYPAILNLGSNSLEVIATNTDGSDTKIALIVFRAKVAVKPPVITILQPVANPTVNTMAYTFQFNALNVIQNQIEVKLNGGIVSSFNFTAPQATFTANLVNGQNVLWVKATNTDGSTSKTANVTYIALKDTTGGQTTNTGTPDTTSSTGGSFDGSIRKMTICHKVAGGTPQTIEVLSTSWPSHQLHGDSKGECPAAANPILVNPPKTSNNVLPLDEKSKETKLDTSNKTPGIIPRRPR